MQRMRLSNDPLMTEEVRLRWKKTGGGVHKHWDGQVVRRDQILKATELEIAPFRNLFVPLDPLPSEKAEEEEPVNRLQIMHRGGGKYNVINVLTDEPINDSLLSKEQAEGLVNDG